MRDRFWFGEKTRQVEFNTNDLGRLVAFGIAIDSRYNRVGELIEMLRFAQAVAEIGLQRSILSLFYDSQADLCTIDYAEPLYSDSRDQPVLHALAKQTISQFQWGEKGDVERGATQAGDS